MFSFVIKRLLQAILVMLIVTLIAFLLFQFVGDPVTQMLGQEATEADRLALTHELGLDQPIWKQFGAFIANTLHGDFGMSLRQGAPVVDLFKEKNAGDARACIFLCNGSYAHRNSVGSLCGSEEKFDLGKLADGFIARWNFSSDIFYRYFADPRVFGLAGMASVLRKRRDGCIWLVDNRPAHRRWSETYHPPRGDFGDLSNCSGDALGTQ